MANPTTRARTRPPIQISRSEAERLSNLALSAEELSPDVAALLLDEIERARVVEDEGLPADVVRMGSRVIFADERSGRRRQIELVYPADADIAAGRVSILTLIGAGLIGLREGQSIAWPDREGQEHLLRIEKVAPPPPAG